MQVLKLHLVLHCPVSRWTLKPLCYPPSVSQGFLSLMGSCVKKPVKILRDTGSLNSFVLSPALPFSQANSTCEFVSSVLVLRCLLFFGTVSALVYELDCDRAVSDWIWLELSTSLPHWQMYKGSADQILKCQLGWTIHRHCDVR